jgi:N-hydroxyarylamine O-acetyltransferase
MDINNYLKRIRYDGNLDTSRDTLFGLQTAHLHAVSYENLDIHLGQHLPVSASHAYQKLLRGRGGWCYELNSVFAWVLRQLGFVVRVVSSGVLRPGGLTPDGDHMLLVVEAEGLHYMVDVGFGDGPVQPLPLIEGQYQAGFLHYELSSTAEHWVLHNHPASNTAGFQFSHDERPDGYFYNRSQALQTDPESGFVTTTVCQRLTLHHLYTLRSVTLTTLSNGGSEKQIIDSLGEYKAVLSDVFLLDVPQIELLWQKAQVQHRQRLQQQQQLAP